MLCVRGVNVSIYSDLKAALIQAVTASNVVTASKIKGGEPSPTHDFEHGQAWCWISGSDGQGRAFTSNRFTTTVSLNTLIFLGGQSSDSALDEALDTAIEQLKTYIFGDGNLNSQCNVLRYSVNKNLEFDGRKRLGTALLDVTVEAEENYSLIANTPLESISLQATYDGETVLDILQEVEG